MSDLTPAAQDRHVRLLIEQTAQQLEGAAAFLVTYAETTGMPPKTRTRLMKAITEIKNSARELQDLARRPDE